MLERERIQREERAALAKELGLDPESAPGAAGLDAAWRSWHGECASLALSIGERLEHFAGRWEREVGATLRRWGITDVSPLPVTFDGIRRSIGVIALPAGPA